jgi:large repetitive protein
MISRFSASLVAAFALLLLTGAAAQARLTAPKLTSPSNRSTVQALPAFTWGSVHGAAQYQFEFSANGNFSSGVNGFGVGPLSLDTTAITNSDTIPDGTYFWRVRAVSATNVPGRWSGTRKLTKHWSTAPKLLSPVSTSIRWPTTPLLLRWAAVPHAVNYQVEIGTSPALSTLVYGPTFVQGTDYAFPDVLSPGTYYWAIRPVDAAGQLGARSAVRPFTWTWPSNTTLTQTDVSPDSTYEEPTFSWTPIAGAASYELQVATDPSYPSNAIILDSTGVIGTNYTPARFFPNHTTLYWRVRAIDSRGDAGLWNAGSSFTETFDQATPSIPNLEVVNPDGTPVTDPTTSDPIVRWSPVPGASAYTVTVTPWVAGQGCIFNSGANTMTTTATAWTLGANDLNATWESQEYGWPGSAGPGSMIYSLDGSGQACVSVIAMRSASPLAGSAIASAPTVIGNGSQPAFSYVLQPPSGTLTASDVVTYSPGIVPPAAGKAAVPASSTLATAPLFEWQPIQAADGYYVIVANDEHFDPNSIVAGGYTNGTSWAMPQSLPDQTSAFWWEVIPVTAGGEPLASAEDGSYNPQEFDKNSVPPQPVSPIGGANVPTQPTFSWKSAQGAVSYTLEISTDPTFANPIETDSTDSTSFTSGTTLPAGKTLYWRVSANDVSYTLNWSAVQTFTHNLPSPQPLSKSPKSGSKIPLMSWSPVTGASSYNLLITTAAGTSTMSVDTPYMTPAEFFTPGLSKWQVQTVFPGGATSASSGQASYKRTIPQPNGIHATKSGSRILVTWKPDPIAKSYVIQLSTTTGFGSPIAGSTTENTAWVPQLTAAQTSVKLYWRLAAVDSAGNVGAYHGGVFKAPRRHQSKPKPKHKRKH